MTEKNSKTLRTANSDIAMLEETLTEESAGYEATFIGIRYLRDSSGGWTSMMEIRFENEEGHIFDIQNFVPHPDDPCFGKRLREEGTAFADRTGRLWEQFRQLSHATFFSV